MRRAKIVCTIGPASGDAGTLKRLADAGMDVARLNFSHGTYDAHREVYERIRKLDGRAAIVQDLQGPKIRVGVIDGEGLNLGVGDRLILTPGEASGEGGLVHVSYPKLPEEVGRGDTIYIADGTINLEVEGIDGDKVRCRVVNGGLLTSNKGVNLPGVKMSVPAMTEKDRKDLGFGLELGVDYVALSFVRSAEEVVELKKLIDSRGSTARVIAKVEKREAVDNLASIIDAADAVMIARGDLGVEISLEEVPVFQKAIIEACIARGKPVITATQMLESMVGSERPTRAEASDVANAVIDGTDALMLSAETATGRFPVETVVIMDRIIRRAEDYGDGGGAREKTPLTACGGKARTDIRDEDSDAFTDAVCGGAVRVSREIGAEAIACITHSGRTARMMARRRPGVPIIALTDVVTVARQMNLVWGVEAIPIDSIEATEEVLEMVHARVSEAGYRGRIVVTAGIPTGERKSTNTVHVFNL